MWKPQVPRHHLEELKAGSIGVAGPPTSLGPEGGQQAPYSPVWCGGQGRFHGIHGVHWLGSSLKARSVGGRKQPSLVLMWDSAALAARTKGSTSVERQLGDPGSSRGQGTRFRVQGLGSGDRFRVQGLGTKQRQPPSTQA